MSKRFEFEVWQEGERVASVFGPDRGKVLTEASRYAFLYGQDGPVKLMERIGRKRVLISETKG